MRRAVINEYTPKIVCLCGSTRFRDDFHEAARAETLKGNIVLMPHVFGYKGRGTLSPEWEQAKVRLDELSIRQIDLSDEVLVVNVNGYIGDGCRREIKYAQKLCIPVRYMEYSLDLTSSPLTEESP